MASNPEIKVSVSADSSALFNELNKMTSGVKQATDQLSGSFNGVGNTLNALKGPVMALVSIFGGGALFGSAIKDTIDFSKEINRLSSVMGISKKDATALQIAIGDIYGDTDTFLSGASKFTKALNSNEERITQLTGVRTRDNGVLRNSLTIMLEVLQGMDKYKAGLDRDVVAQELFGKSFQEMLKYAKLTTETMLDAEKKVTDLGLAFGVVGEQKVATYRAAVNDLDDSFIAMKKNITVALLPSLSSLGDVLASVLSPTTKILIPIINGLTSALSMTTVQVLLAGTAVYTAAKAFAALGIAKTFISDLVVFNGVLRLEGAAIGTAGIKAFGTAVYSALGPIGIAIGVIAGLAAAFEYLSKMEERAAKGSKTVSDQFTAKLEATKQFTDQAGKYLTIYNDPNSSAESKSKAKRNLSDIIDIYKKEWKATSLNLDDLIKLSANPDKLKSFLNTQLDQATSDFDARIKQQEDKLVSVEAAIKAKLGKLKNPGKDETGATSVARYSEADIEKEIADSVTLKNLNQEINKLKKDRIALLDVEENKKTSKKPLTSEQMQVLYESRRAQLSSGDQLYKLNLDQEHDFWLEMLTQVKVGTGEYSSVKGNLKAIQEKRREEERKDIERDHKRALDELGQDKESRAEAEETFAADMLSRLGKHDEMYKKAEEAAYAAKLARRKETEKVLLETQTNTLNEGVQKYELMQEIVKQAEEQGLISKEESFKKFQDLEFKKYNAMILIKQLEKERAVVENGANSSEVTKLNGEIQKLTVARNYAANKLNEIMVPDQQLEGPLEGMMQFKNQFLSIAGQLKQATFNIFSGLQNTLQSTMMGLLQGQIRAGMVLQSIWKGLGTTVATEITKMVSAKIASWTVDKAISAWNSINTKKETAENAEKTSGNIVTGVSGFWASLSPMGWVGVILAGLAVAAMLASISSVGGNASGGSSATPAAAGYSDHGSGLQFTGRAVGGLVSKPEFTLLGEAGPEIVAPESSFRDYSVQLMSESISGFMGFMNSKQAGISSYSAQASQFASLGENANSPRQTVIQLNDCVVADGAEKQLYDMHQNYLRKNG